MIIQVVFLHRNPHIGTLLSRYLQKTLFFLIFLYISIEKGPKHKSESIDMSPNVPDLKILNLAFSHRLESSYQWATVAPFFNIKVTIQNLYI